MPDNSNSPLQQQLQQQQQNSLTLSLLNRHIKIKHDKQLIEGELYYFSSKALIILKKNSQFVMVNVENYQQLNIQVVEGQGQEGKKGKIQEGQNNKEDHHAKRLQQQIKKEEIKASEIVALLIDR